MPYWISEGLMISSIFKIILHTCMGHIEDEKLSELLSSSILRADSSTDIEVLASFCGALFSVILCYVSQDKARISTSALHSTRGQSSSWLAGAGVHRTPWSIQFRTIQHGVQKQQVRNAAWARTRPAASSLHCLKPRALQPAANMLSVVILV